MKENLHDTAEFGIWKIEEDADFYLAGLLLSTWEQEYINAIKNPHRKLQWLASRYLLKQMIGTNEFVELLSDEHGKPYIANMQYNVSISHTENYAGVIVSKDHVVGIDVEEPQRNVQHLKNKFLSATELEQLQTENYNTQLLIYWSAKEVMYKIYGKRKLEFKDDMFVRPFLLNKRGSIHGVLMKNGSTVLYDLHYICAENFTVVAGAGII